MAFGEVALLRKVERTASIVASPDTTLLYVYKEDFDKVTKRIGNVVYMPEKCKQLLGIDPAVRTEEDANWLVDMLSGHRFFNRLDPPVVKDMCRTLTLLKLKPGDVLFSEGDSSDSFYIILSGQVSLHTFAGDDDEFLSAVVNNSSIVDKTLDEDNVRYGKCASFLGVGDSFGEKALITNEPLQVTAVAREKTDIMVLKREVFQAHLGVLSQAIAHVDNLRRLLTLRPEHRTEEDLGLLAEMIAANAFFASMESKIFQEICRVAKYRNIAADTPVFLQGDAPDGFYVILTGTLSVHVAAETEAEQLAGRVQRGSIRAREPTMKQQEERRKVRRKSVYTDPSAIYGPRVAILASGQSFGELALINSAPRAATILAQEASEMLLIMKQDYESVLQEQQSKELNEKISILREIPALKDLPTSRLSKLSYTIQETLFPRDTNIVLEDEPGKDIYFLKEGECKVTRKVRRKQVLQDVTLPPIQRVKGAPKEYYQQNEPKSSSVWIPNELELLRLGPGQFFGEYALLNKTKQPVSVITVSYTKVYVLKGDDVMKLLSNDLRTVTKLQKYSKSKNDYLIERYSQMISVFKGIKETSSSDRMEAAFTKEADLDASFSRGLSEEGPKTPKKKKKLPFRAQVLESPERLVRRQVVEVEEEGGEEEEERRASAAPLSPLSRGVRRSSRAWSITSISSGIFSSGNKSWDQTLRSGARLANSLWTFPGGLVLPNEEDGEENKRVVLPKASLESYKMKMNLILPKIKKGSKSKGGMKVFRSVFKDWTKEGEGAGEGREEKPREAEPEES